jgi:DNA-binding response OmpR family regulator
VDNPKPTILLIDDSMTVLTKARVVLEKAGFNVLTRTEAIGSGAEVLRKKPDLVLIDVVMPMVEGDSIVKSLRKASVGHEVLVVLHSALPAPDLEERARFCGASGFICKTNNGDDFLRQVTGFLARREQPCPPGASGSQGSQILVVAREPILAATIQLVLAEFSDLEIVRVETPAVAKALPLGQSRYACVVIAEERPDAAPFVSSLRQFCTGVPVIVIGSESSPEAIQKANLAGVSHYLTKPAPAAALRAAVREALQCTDRDSETLGKRQFVRLRISVHVAWEGTGPFPSHTWDLSERGAFVCSSQLPEPGATVRLTFTMPNLEQPLSLESKVVHVRTRPVDFYPAGFGVSFADGDKQALATLAHALQLR